jgi:DNA-binding NtrC family response regulator
MSDPLPDQIRVLHVDDEPDLAELTATFLERENERFTVETATSADEGLELVDEPRPDCVISDYSIPGTDGLEFLQVVREEHPELPFILYTAKARDAIGGDELPATGYLQKGAGPEQYARLADQVCDAVQSQCKHGAPTETRGSD